MKKTIRRRRQKHRERRELSLRADEIKNLKTEVKNKTDALKQIISHNEEAKDVVKLKIKELKKIFLAKTSLISRKMLKCKRRKMR